MKKIFLFFTLILVGFSCPLLSMKHPNNTMIEIGNHYDDRGIPICSELIAYVASFLYPKGKNALARTNEYLRLSLQKNKTLILHANPYTVGDYDKIEAMTGLRQATPKFSANRMIRDFM